MKNYVYIAPEGDAWRNLAIDEHLLNTLGEGELCLFLYVNSDCVVIGRNQNPWLECDLEAMARDGVKLVRRISGGGAVYHDRGNLNYSFIGCASRYDEARQNALLLRVLQSLGIEAELSGRNDICAGDRKVSGTAYCSRGERRQQHGTLLVDANLEALGAYLTVSPKKLEGKGVASVRSRVTNMKSLNPGLSVERLSEALIAEFAAEYGGCERLEPDADFSAGVQALYERNSSREWLLGSSPEFDYTLEERFPFGMARLCINIRNGRISELSLFTDALDPELPEKLRARLLGRPFEPGELPDLIARAVE